MPRAIQVRAECDALVRHVLEVAQAEDLEAARVGQNRAGPRHESMKAAHSPNQLMPGPQIEMVGVGEQNLNVETFEVLLGLAFDGRGRADGHERRRLDDAMRGRKASQARTGRIGCENLEMKTHLEKLYQENAAVIPTFARTYRSHALRMQMNAFPNESFFGAATL